MKCCFIRCWLGQGTCPSDLGMINPRLVLPWITKKMRSRVKVFRTYSTTSMLSLFLDAFIFNPDLSYNDKLVESLISIGYYCGTMAIIALINPIIPFNFSRAEPTKYRMFLSYSAAMLVFIISSSLFMSWLTLLDKLIMLTLVILIYSVSVILLSFIIRLFKMSMGWFS